MKHRTILVCLLILSLLCFTVPVSAAADDPPELRIKITQCPVYGVQSPSLKGYVYSPDGSAFDPSEYIIVYYVTVLSVNWVQGYTAQYYDPGHAHEQAYTHFRFNSLDSSGKFESAFCPTASGGIATRFTVLLVNKSDEYNVYTHSLEAEPVCSVTIERTETQLTFTHSGDSFSTTVTPENGIYIDESEPPAPQPPDPHITLSYVPPYGNGKNITGCIASEKAFRAKDYILVAGLQLSEGSTVYWKPSVTPGSSGAFSYWFTNGAGDENAQVLTLYLFPAAYAAYSDFSAHTNKALDRVVIRRSVDGSVTLNSNRWVAEPHSLRADIAVSPDKLALDVGFYTDGSIPDAVLSQEQVNAILDAALPLADAVRFYKASGTIEKAYAMAKSKGFKVVGMAYLGENKDAHQQELDALISRCKENKLSLAIVGNEVLLNGHLSEQELIKDIEYVRERLEGTGIPVATSDTINFFIDSPDLRRAVDVILPNVYPYWVNITDPAAALENFRGSMTALINICGDKQIIISEVGMPTQDAASDLGAQAAAYFEGVRQWSLETGVPALMFELADEPFKQIDEGPAGPHWGFLDTQLQLKPCYRNVPFFADVYAPVVVLPADTITIDDKAFAGCVSMQKILIPSTVTEISDNAFTDCPGLTILAEKGSYAHQYALDHKIPWKAP